MAETRASEGTVTPCIGGSDGGMDASASAHLAVAAEDGDRRAAETLIVMYRLGEQLYGAAFRADPVKVAHWTNIAVALRRGVAWPDVQWSTR